MSLMRNAVLFLLFYLIVNPAFAGENAQIPDPLKPWTGWVLHDHEEEYLCVPQHNDSSKLRCSWPTELKLRMTGTGGTFEQEWFINHESWIMLPGSDRFWPENVKINNEPAVVLKKNNRPRIKLPKGSYRITGEFHWQKLPEHLLIPPQSALVSLVINDKKNNFPNIDDQGRLWLQAQRHKEEKIENRLNIQNFRLIDDMIPPRIVLYMNLDVAGSAREILLGPAFAPEEFVPVLLSSSLPARVERDGRIRIQIRPGQWSLTLTVRHTGPLLSLMFNKPEDGFWPKEEIWAFSAQTNLRIVEIEGLPSIDPQQTSMPEHWRNYPAYRVLAGNTMRLKAIKRGDPHPAPDQLTLKRNLWLRFDGSGYAIQDNISGKKSNEWRLEMNPLIDLGRVAVDGVEQFITRQKGSDKAGIELRRGKIQLTADSESLGSISKLPATGWDQDFQQVSTSLFLPPGYRIISATGMDNVPNTWLTRWTLLDLFVVLIFSIAVARLYSHRLSAIAFLTLVLLYHEPGAPRWIWLAILIGVALLRYLPECTFRKAAKLYHIIVAVLLISIAVPFAIGHLRVGIYPQLEKPRQSMAFVYSKEQMVPSVPLEETEEMLDETASLEKKNYRAPAKRKGRILSTLKGALESDSYSYRDRSRVAQYDPSMINQTGPGLPAWQWNTIVMNSGPVQRGQEISLIFTGPNTNLILSFLRVGLLIVLALGIFGIGYKKSKGWHYPDLKTFLVILLFISGLFTPELGRADSIPSPEMFKELQSRLLEKDDCFPACAAIGDMTVNITPEHLQVTMNVDSQVEVALPLPGNSKHWLPQEVTIDGQKTKALFRTPSGLWISVPAGKHVVALKGTVPGYNTIQLPLPLKPHRIEIIQKGWTSEGVHQDGRIDNQIQFKRITSDETLANQILDSGVLPPFALVQRTLLLGLDWKIVTRVQRISPTGSAIVLNIPLVQGESVITEGVQVNNGRAQVNLDAQTRQIQWESVLEKEDAIVLEHADTNLWTEIWQVDVSPIYHMEHEGIPVILHQQGNRWNPKWHPWPGEMVTINISRPSGVEGQTLTIDKSYLEVRPGQRVTDSKLTLSLRSSQGAQHKIILPEGVQLQEVTIGGRPQPIRQEGRHVPLPIIPGSQTIVLKWRGQSGMSMQFKTPEIDLGIQNANVHIDVSLPHNRWPLYFTGPQLGPAILFWSVVIVIVLVAFGLSRTGLTPLKFIHWFLLGIGLSQSNIFISLIIVGWLMALHFRKKANPDMNKITFNIMQAGIAGLTVLALGGLVSAISQGLLGHPDMNIAGNGSGGHLLRWYQDYSSQKIPQASIFSIPMITYRLAMLAWSLWISFYLISLLKWGWQNFTHTGIWQSLPKRTKPARKVNLFKKGDASPSKE